MASADEYNAFIRQIELRAVWLSRADVANNVGSEPPDRTDVTVHRRSRWEAATNGFQAFDEYEIILGSEDQPAARIAVTLGLAYDSNELMSDALFDPFQQFNLPLNAWPYAREFVANTTARMNWVPFTLPALQLGGSGD